MQLAKENPVTIDKLKLAIEVFKALHKDLATSRGADGMCGWSHDEFVDTLSRHLPESVDFRLVHQVTFITDQAWGASKPWRERQTTRFCRVSQAPHNWYDQGCRWHSHAVTRIGNICVDFTARQFKGAEESPWPLVFELED